MDTRAFVAIYEKNKMKIYSYVLYKVRTAAIAEDITSDVFVKLLKELEKNQEVREYAVAWLYRVANNMIIDHFRSSYHQKNVTESEVQARNSNEDDEPIDKDVFVAEYDDMLESLAKEEDQKKILDALKELKQADRDIIEFRLFQELPFKEIAVILDTSEGAVKMKYGRAIDKLKIVQDEKDK